MLDAGEAAASAGEDRFATRRDGAEDGAGGTGMCFKDDDGNDSTPASESDDKEAACKNGGAMEERDRECEEDYDNKEAAKLWSTLAISFVMEFSGKEGGRK